MTRYDMLTETIARTLERGTTVTLAKGGHVTPLALDTLRERRVTLVRDGEIGDTEGLAPVASPTRFAVGSDHSGLALRKAVRDHLRGRGLAVQEVGLDTPDPVDYPDIAGQVARLVARREVDAGIVIDGAGLGSAIAANKIDGIRCAMCTDKTLARYAREHNGANVLTLGGGLVGARLALAIVETFLATPFAGGRHQARVAKIDALDASR